LTGRNRYVVHLLDAPSEVGEVEELVPFDERVLPLGGRDLGDLVVAEQSEDAGAQLGVIGVDAHGCSLTRL
jgi:hypothetical protein